jgi:2'-5' RNA ligase
LRCFVAVDLSDEAREAVARVQARLREAAPRADVRWTAPASLHLTLVFLGEVAFDVQPGIAAALAEVAGRHEAFHLAAAGVGGFPSLERPRVLWVGLTEGLRELGRLAADVERALVPLGFPLADRPFSGHVTLGRVRSPPGLRPLVDVARAFEPALLARWRVRDVVLYQSQLGPRGSIHAVLARVPLVGASASTNAPVA